MDEMKDTFDLNDSKEKQQTETTEQTEENDELQTEDTTAKTEENEELKTEEKAEVKKKKLTPNEARLQELKDKLKNLQEESKCLQENIKVLQEKNDKSDIEKEEIKKQRANLKEIKAQISEMKIEKAKQQKKVDIARTNAVIKTEGKKLAERKLQAISKVLEAEELYTENGVKGLIALRRVCMKYNVTGNKTLEKCLEHVKHNAPHLLSNG